jgi:hypothetical protein
MKRLALTVWLTLLCFLLLSNVHAWEVPSCVRINGGVRMWFGALEGDLIQPDRTKLDLADNIGLKRDNLIWEFFASTRINSIHVVRFRAEPYSLYEQSRGDSFLKVRDFRLGYDFDFFMNPQVLFGANLDLDFLTVDSRVSNIVVANQVFSYSDSQTYVTPALGIHGTFYPILTGISLRPNITSRANWWNYQTLETWDWEVAGGVDIPVNQLWTWSINAGYRFWHVKIKRDRDTLDMNRSGFFLETAVLF